MAVSDDGAAVALGRVEVREDLERRREVVEDARRGEGGARGRLPGGRKLVAGLKSGVLLEVDAASGDTKEARDSDGSVATPAPSWLSRCPSSDGQNLSWLRGDPLVKLWTHGMTVSRTRRPYRSKAKNARRSPFRNVRAGRAAVCVATTDHCVRVLYADTFKFKVSLYGHSLPCLCVGGSSDGKLLATGSSDKTLKLWGLEFGDLRRSILAHDDAVTGLAWLRGTHYCITTSKDGSVKQWDCDRLETPLCNYSGGATRRKSERRFEPDGSALTYGSGSSIKMLG